MAYIKIPTKFDENHLLSEKIVDVFSVRLFNLVKARNAWHSTPVTIRDSKRLISRTLDGAMILAEEIRTQGTSFIIRETVGVCIVGNLYRLTVAESGCRSPLGQFSVKLTRDLHEQSNSTSTERLKFETLSDVVQFYHKSTGRELLSDPSSPVLIDIEEVGEQAPDPLSWQGLKTYKSISHGSSYRLNWANGGDSEIDCRSAMTNTEGILRRILNRARH